MSFAPPEVEPHGVHVVDTGFVRPHFDAAFLIVENGRGAFIETGTTHSLPRLLEAVEHAGLTRDAVDYVIPTHVHLDHAGGAGALMRELPNAKLVVHPRGVRHMIDPTQLLAGARAVYGDEEVARSYGEVPGVAVERVIATADGIAAIPEPDEANNARASGEVKLGPDLVVDALLRERGRQAQHRLLLGRCYTDSGFVCVRDTGEPMSSSVLWHAWRALRERAGLPELRFHDQRHANISLALAAGVPLPVVSKRAGHFSPSFTAATYAHAVEGADADAAETLGGVLPRRQSG